jgi:hypothetical protein
MRACPVSGFEQNAVQFRQITICFVPVGVFNSPYQFACVLLCIKSGHNADVKCAAINFCNRFAYCDGRVVVKWVRCVKTINYYI